VARRNTRIIAFFSDELVYTVTTTVNGTILRRQDMFHRFISLDISREAWHLRNDDYNLIQTVKRPRTVEALGSHLELLPPLSGSDDPLHQGSSNLVLDLASFFGGGDTRTILNTIGTGSKKKMTHKN